MWLLFGIGALSALSISCQAPSERAPEPTKPSRPALEFTRPVAQAPAPMESPEQLPQHPAPERLLELPGWLVSALSVEASPSVTEALAATACERARPVRRLQQLAAPGRTIMQCVANERATPPIPRGEFTRGCMLLRRSWYVILDGATWRKASNPTQLHQILGPARTQAEAVGRVALVMDEHWLPLSREDRERALASHRDWQSVGPIVAAKRGATGFSVRLPMSPHCGCEHPISVRSFSLGFDGSLSSGDDPSALLARPNSRICAD
jgi:hypothetical protein